MHVAALSLRDFRSHHRITVEPGESLTVIVGPNGAGKTNLVEALHFALTGRSCRTSSDRRVISHDADVARSEVTIVDRIGSRRTMASAIDRSGTRESTVDGTPVDASDLDFERPLVTVFLPDRLTLVTGPPGGRRAHLDGLSVALGICGRNLRNDYSKALIQRNAALASARSTGSMPKSIHAWTKSLARIGSALVEARGIAVDEIAAAVTSIASDLGLAGDLELRHQPGGSPDPEAFEQKLESMLDADVERGYTWFGPHRGDFLLQRKGRDIKEHGSQGERRMALLALLLAERERIAEKRGSWPLLLLDDVMSELDASRRRLLVERVTGAGQCVITATESSHVPVDGVQGVRSIDLGAGSPAGLRAA